MKKGEIHGHTSEKLGCGGLGSWRNHSSPEVQCIYYIQLNRELLHINKEVEF